MSYLFGFEKLEVWQESKDLAILVYKITKNFPKEEKYGLTSQITRAAVSIPSNIAEGNLRNTAKERAHFITIAYGSLMEVASLLTICHEMNLIIEREYQDLRDKTELISNKLNALRNYHQNKSRK